MAEIDAGDDIAFRTMTISATRAKERGPLREPGGIKEPGSRLFRLAADREGPQPTGPLYRFERPT